MSSHRILLFLVTVYALLAGLSAVFPEDGIDVFGVTLNFPDAKEAAASLLHREAPPKGPSPEELIAMRMEAVRQAEQDRFESYFRENPARIHFPDGRTAMFDPLFEALDNASEKGVRILHYGDSQLEEDRISSAIRKGLQEKFGGGGPGLLPFGRPYYTMCISQSSTANLQRALVFGEGSRRSDGRYGIMGQLARLDTSVYTTVSPVKGNTGPTRYFNRMTMLAGNISGTLNLKCNGRQYSCKESDAAGGVARITVELPDSSTTVRFSTWGSADIYGFQLDAAGGVSVDNIPMRGSSGTVFTRMNGGQLREYAANDNVRLVILQFGGNSMPYRKSGKAISEYKTSIEKQIRCIQAAMPKAAVLFIGPSDMSTNIKGKMQTYPHLPMMVDSLKAAANNCGAAYWDLYSAMGGENSMVEWVKARPPLAGGDYVHFTPRGAQAMGEMFFESFMLYYEYYRWRKYGKGRE